MSTIVQKTEIEDQFTIAPNPKFNILPHRGITRLENTAVSTLYPSVTETLNGALSTTLSYQVGERTFLDRGVFLEVDVPVILTRATAWGTAPTAATYLTLAETFKGIAFRQFGLLSCLDQLTVQFNQAPVSSLTNLYRCFDQTSEYYNGVMVDEFFPASQPDRFISYEHYASSGTTEVETLNEDGDKIRMLIPPISQENVFTGGYSTRYNSRRPAFKFVAATTTSLQVQVKCMMYLPFSHFATPDAETSLYGINHLSIQPQFVDNWVKRLFVTKGTFWSSVDFDTTNQSKHKISLRMKTYQAPEYVVNAMIDKNGLPKPYRIGYNKVTPQPPRALSSVQPLSKGNIAISEQIAFGSLPKHIYIGIHPMNIAGSTTVPNFKGRITHLEVTVGGATTIIGGSALNLYQLCKGNGLQKDYDAAMFTNGYVVKLDVSKDISVGGNLIGANVPVTFQFTVHYDNLDTEVGGRLYEMRIATTFPSQLVYDNREFKLFTSLVMSNAPYDISNQAAALYAELSPVIMTIGAGVMGDIWNGVKKAGRAAVKWVKDNPDQVASMIGKGVRALVGGNVPYQQNMSGGSSTLLLGAGNMNQNPFK